MCLDTVLKEPPPSEGTGWKVFTASLECPVRQGGPLRSGVWLRAQVDRLLASDGSWYPAGWHLFPMREDAEDYAFSTEQVRRVRYRGGHTQGEEVTGVVVLVAAELYVEPRTEEEP